MRVAPPISKTAEASLLGACIKHDGALDAIVDVIEPSAFYTPAYATIYSAVCRVAVEGEITSVAVVENLRESGELSDIGGEHILTRLVEDACETSEVKKTASVVYELARKRDTIEAARRVATAAMRGEDDGGAFEDLVLARNATTAADGWTPLETIVAGVLTGTHRRTEPTILTREDGAPLLYEARLNWIAGPPESQKSYLAALAVVQELAAGRPAVYIDFEETDGVTISERVVAIGVGNGHTRDAILDWVCGPVTDTGGRDASKRLLWYTNARTLNGKIRTKTVTAIKRGARLVILDGCAAAMGAADLQEDSAKDVNLWLAGAVWPLTRAGAAVLVIDHIVKNAQQGVGGFASRSPRGSGAKLAAVSGVTLIAEPKEPGSAFTEGRVELWVTKDRPGRIRTSKRGAKRLAGLLVSTPEQVDGLEVTRLRVLSPDDEADALTKEEREEKWKAIAAERIVAVLDAADGAMSKSEVKESLKRKADDKGTKGLRAETIVSGFEILVDGGWVTMEKDGREQKLTLVRAYRADYGTAHSSDVAEDPF